MTRFKNLLHQKEQGPALKPKKIKFLYYLDTFCNFGPECDGRRPQKVSSFPSIFPSHSVDISFWLHRSSSSSSTRKMRRKQPKKGGNSLKRKLKSSRCKTIYWNFSTSQLSTNGQVTFFNFSLPLKDFWVLKYYCTHTLVKLSKIV